MQNDGTKRDLENARKVHQPLRYELVDKDGNVVGWASSMAGIAAMVKLKFGDQEQDEERTGKGWDIAVVGAGR